MLALTIKESLLLTAALSAVHVLGFTLVTGGALVSNLRLAGSLFPGRQPAEITGPASLGIAVGLVVSIGTGLLLFAPRAVAASANDTFRVKMLLLVGAAIFQFAVHRRVARRAFSSRGLQRLTGVAGLTLWAGLALAGCAYILLE